MRTTTGVPIEQEQRRGGRGGPAIDLGGGSRVHPREVAGVLRLSYGAGAPPGNTILLDANDSAKPIDLEGVNFDELRAKSNLIERCGILGFDPRARCRPPLCGRPCGRSMETTADPKRVRRLVRERMRGREPSFSG